ncbi:DUF4097 domain-containing protein [Cohnella lubricantis]|uniref:DUF4097 family beta strand repeat protein n=1 Tax=Cohnella lubricantis TaxID=2163172 RepID=A0A841TBF3_9BACL|nr:DUF4097 family beta strand repeat-containing protein [Cohnella lubricantis]MBB6676708.1 DUF4097 family beta strand repeat protein [Cohnella lubricantis]MBP2117754.1 DUF4097 and DUF4098 domain-containing protein YvlB [Cohnella lubricantis]
MKKWISIAIGLIAIGVGGAALFGFTFDKPLPAYSQKWTFSDGELRNLNVNLDYQAAVVDFVPSEDGNNSVVIEGKAKQEIIDNLKNVKLTDGELSLDLDSRDTWFSLNFDFSFDRQHITVALTEEAAQALDTVRVYSDAGSLKTSGIRARTASIATDSGSIQVVDSVSGQLSIKSDSGSIRASDIHADLQVSSDSGSITVDHLTGTAALASDSGSVKLVKDDLSGADIKSDSGSVRVQLPAAFGGIFDLRSDSGSIHAPDSKGTSQQTIKVRTDSGSIRITES